MIYKALCAVNIISMLVLLGRYVWGDAHAPADLAIGISNGFVALFLLQVCAMEKRRDDISPLERK